MPDVDKLFTTVEQYEGMTIQYLLVRRYIRPHSLCPSLIAHHQFSKIGKVMRHIAAPSQERIPRDSEFGFRDRAKILADRWQEVLDPSKANGTDTGNDVAHNGGAAVEANGNAEGGDHAVEDDSGKAQPERDGAEGNLPMMGEVTMSEA
jgi:hypothetical protein